MICFTVVLILGRRPFHAWRACPCWVRPCFCFVAVGRLELSWSGWLGRWCIWRLVGRLVGLGRCCGLVGPSMFSCWGAFLPLERLVLPGAGMHFAWLDVGALGRLALSLVGYRGCWNLVCWLGWLHVWFCSLGFRGGGGGAVRFCSPWVNMKCTAHVSQSCRHLTYGIRTSHKRRQSLVRVPSPDQSIARPPGPGPSKCLSPPSLTLASHPCRPTHNTHLVVVLAGPSTAARRPSSTHRHPA